MRQPSGLYVNEDSQGCVINRVRADSPEKWEYVRSFDHFRYIVAIAWTLEVAKKTEEAVYFLSRGSKHYIEVVSLDAIDQEQLPSPEERI